MAATTLATSLALIGDYKLRSLIYDHFVKPDPFMARVPFKPSPGGHTWTQDYTTEPSNAAEMVVTDTIFVERWRTGGLNASNETFLGQNAEGLDEGLEVEGIDKDKNLSEDSLDSLKGV